MKSKQISSYWKEIEESLQLLDIPIPSKGLRAADVRAFEKEIKRSLPDSYKASLCVHAEAPSIIPDALKSGLGYNAPFSLMDPKESVNRWKSLTQLYDSGEFDDRHQRIVSSREVVKLWWSPGWIPFATNGGGDFYCIDLVPTWPGVNGQVVGFWHEYNVRPVLAKSFDDFLRQLAEGYSSESYKFGPTGKLCRKKVSVFPANKLKE